MPWAGGRQRAIERREWQRSPAAADLGRLLALVRLGRPHDGPCAPSSPYPAIVTLTGRIAERCADCGRATQ